MANNSQSLSSARKNKADEFYTSYVDIKKEILAYDKSVWQNKTVYLPCDDPNKSQFWQFFSDNFQELKLSKLIATYLAADNNSFLTILDKEYGIDIHCIDGCDFRSTIAQQLMRDSDIIVTNPPFSLFREFLAQVIKYQKQYIILGNVNAVTNKDIFKLIMDNQLWFGPSIHSGDREFKVPDSYPLTAVGVRVDNEGNKFVRVKGVRWFTNIEYCDRFKDLILVKEDINDLQKFDNYNALNIDKVKNIPVTYDGVMGVPITFLDKWNPNQFEILGLDVMMPDNPRPNKRFLYKRKETYGRIMIRHTSKPLRNPDISAFELHKRIFQDQPTAAINFDALFFHPKKGYFVVEYLLCDEHQTVTPWTSHPNRYWHKNWRKFVALYNAAKKLGGQLLLVNYAKENTAHSDEIKAILVEECDPVNGITKSQECNMTFAQFQQYYQNFNNECLQQGL